MSSGSTAASADGEAFVCGWFRDPRLKAAPAVIDRPGNWPESKDNEL